LAALQPRPGGFKVTAMPRRPRAPRRLPLALASCALVGIAAWLAFPRAARWRARALASEAYTALDVCLFTAEERGDASLRRRAIAATLSAEGASWPGSCKEPAAALAVSLSALRRHHDRQCDGRCCADDDACRSIETAELALDELRVAFEHQAFTGQAAALASACATLGLELPSVPQALPADASPAGIEPAVPLSRPLASRRMRELALDPPRHAGLALLLFDPAREAVLCRTTLLQPAPLTCQRLAPAIALDGPLAPAAADPTVATVVLSTADGVVDATGRRLTSAGERVIDAEVAADRLRVLSDDDAGLVVRDIALASGVEVGRRTLRAIAPSLGPRLLGGAVIWATAAEQGHELWLEAAGDTPRSLGTTGIAHPEAQLEICSHDGMAVAVVRAPPSGYNTRVAVALGRGHDLRLARHDIDSRWAGLTCDAKGASLSWIDVADEAAIDGLAPLPPATPVRGSYRVARLRCRRDGCTREGTTLHLERHSRHSRYLVASLGERVTVLWRSPFGELRLRAGMIDELDGADTQLVVDDEAHGGVAWEGASTSLLVRGEAALLIVEDPSGAPRALYLDAHGRARGLAVAHGG
jgi:hypothetical protein